MNTKQIEQEARALYGSLLTFYDLYLFEQSVELFSKRMGRVIGQGRHRVFATKKA